MFRSAQKEVSVESVRSFLKPIRKNVHFWRMHYTAVRRCNWPLSGRASCRAFQYARSFYRRANRTFRQGKLCPLNASNLHLKGPTVVFSENATSWGEGFNGVGCVCNKTNTLAGEKMWKQQCVRDFHVTQKYLWLAGILENNGAFLAWETRHLLVKSISFAQRMQRNRCLR